MKNTKLLATLVLGSAALTAAALFIRKKRREKKLIEISNAGYELAYDIQYPIRYRN